MHRHTVETTWRTKKIATRQKKPNIRYIYIAFVRIPQGAMSPSMV